jgi:hypothetical protein
LSGYSDESETKYGSVPKPEWVVEIILFFWSCKNISEVIFSKQKIVTFC